MFEGKNNHLNAAKDTGEYIDFIKSGSDSLKQKLIPELEKVEQ